MSTYRSPFDRWDEHSAVRAMETSGKHWAQGAEGDWMLAESWSVAHHPTVLARGRHQAVQAALLLSYLDFTIQLEAECVGPVGRDLALRRLGADYEAVVVRDALRVQCDEAFHALLCEELSEHVGRVAGIRRRELPEHFFFRRVRELATRTGGALDPGQFAFCVAVVSETVITELLQNDWRGASLRPEVRNVLLHHYKDEIRHSAFFSQSLRIIWPQWPQAARDAMGPLWPELVRAFVRVDGEGLEAALAMAGFNAEEAAQVVSDSLRAEGAAACRRASFEQTLRALEKAGVLEGAGARAELSEHPEPFAVEVAR